ncbi:L-histidine N(alpha)-methyltransferase [Salinisphaera sp.]|uniref:L-histidine N(alpha)-methyltransferase n=1 Tax=Salinisphaera sp. TaxID=1914330 RepID=UPI000C47BE89|nr:L-histidine N(alpha)-methyltransferase [Salinisphaera sp.]MBS63908.1 L-histidine N(alpha)-methyltransferase [Salinisphaera sp.]
MTDSPTGTRLTSTDVAPERQLASLADDVSAGLLAPPRWLSPKYFYDDHGSALFEAICATPEYYPSRSEAGLLAAHGREIIEAAAPEHMLELGSGSSRKTRHLLDACDALNRPCRYWPFDVSAQMMLDAGAQLVADYDWLSVHALIGDYTGGLANVPLPDQGRRLIVFLGGTLGNFEPADALAMLEQIAALMRDDDRLLLGVDRVKDTATLEAAYDDAEGVTADFNRNVLRVLNRELDGDFPVQDYSHRAVFDRDMARIEMRLAADHAHRVTLAALDTTIDIEAGEEIVTEFSHKFTPDTLAALLETAGLTIDRHFEAEGGAYSLVLAGKANP